MHTAWGHECCGSPHVIGYTRRILLRQRKFQGPVVNGGITTTAETTVLLSAQRGRHLVEFGERQRLNLSYRRW